MALPEDCRLAYYVIHEQWHYDAVRACWPNPTISVTAVSDGGGCAWEFMIEEQELGGRPTTQVKMFDDAYLALLQVPVFFAALAAQEPSTLREIRGILDAIGAEDITVRETPAEYARPPR